jgi:hypothetical protein
MILLLGFITKDKERRLFIWSTGIVRLYTTEVSDISQIRLLGSKLSISLFTHTLVTKD